MKKIALSIVVFSLLLFAGKVDTGFTHSFNDIKQSSYQEMFDSLLIDFNEIEKLEYGYNTWYADKLVNKYNGDSLDTSLDYLETNTVGDTEIVYKVTTSDNFGQELSKSYTKTISIVDTQVPSISFKKDTVEITVGDSFDASANISSVVDPIDGKLAKSSDLKDGTYTVESNVNKDRIGDYTVTVTAKDVNGNVASKNYKVSVKQSTYNHVWDGTVLTPSRGTILGPSGKETYYNLPMEGVVAIMRRMGNNDPYWVREDGVKMLGDYVMVAANLNIRPRGSLIPTSLGMGIVCDTGGFAVNNIYQLDIAVNW